MYTITPHNKDQAALPKAAAAQTDTYTYTKGVLTATSAGAGALPEGDSLSVDNGLLQLNFSKTTGRLTSLANHQAGVATNLTMDMVAYLSGKLPDAFSQDWLDMCNSFSNLTYLALPRLKAGFSPYRLLLRLSPLSLSLQLLLSQK